MPGCLGSIAVSVYVLETEWPAASTDFTLSVKVDPGARFSDMPAFSCKTPLTTWKPSGCAVPVQGGCPQAQFIDPTTNPTSPGNFPTPR